MSLLKGEYDEQERIAKQRGNELLTYLLDCVSRGESSDIQAVFKDASYHELSKLIIGNDLPKALAAFHYVVPQVVRASMAGGLPWETASETYQNYAHKTKQLRTTRSVCELYVQLFIDFTDKVTQARADHDCSPLVRKCHSYIGDHLCETLTVSRIANELRISRSYLSHVYKDETGATISEYIRKRKIAEAKNLLQHGSLTLVEIGERLGYCSQSHFTECFRKETGKTPGQYRAHSVGIQQLATTARN